MHDRKRSTSPRTAFHGVPYPTTLEEMGSDLCRACLTRLCSASRLSQPLDALLHPKPSPPCFMRTTPLGFCFQRVSLPGSQDSLTASHSFMLFLVDPRARRQAGRAHITTPQLQGFSHPGSPYRQPRCYPTDTDRSSPSLAPLRGIHPSGLGPVLPRDLLSWAFTSR